MTKEFAFTCFQKSSAELPSYVPYKLIHSKSHAADSENNQTKFFYLSREKKRKFKLGLHHSSKGRKTFSWSNGFYAMLPY